MTIYTIFFITITRNHKQTELCLYVFAFKSFFIFFKFISFLTPRNLNVVLYHHDLKVSFLFQTLRVVLYSVNLICVLFKGISHYILRVYCQVPNEIVQCVKHIATFVHVCIHYHNFHTTRCFLK